MSGMPVQGPEGVVYAPEYEELPAKSGAGGWLFILLHGVLGGVALALAVSDDFASGKAVFSGDAWRFVLGVIGAGLLFFAARAIVRNRSNQRPRLTPELHERAKRNGAILFVVGAGLVTAALVEGISESSIEFRSWTKPFFATGGIYLMLMGLAFQWNPTRSIRQQRVSRGEGRPGTARIVRASDTGTSVNDAPQVKIEFDLEVGGHTYQVSDKIVMQRARLALLIPGSTVNVLVDKVDPTVFHIDWDSWKGPAAGA